jgi:hypothetical protein
MATSSTIFSEMILERSTNAVVDFAMKHIHRQLNLPKDPLRWEGKRCISDSMTSFPMLSSPKIASGYLSGQFGYSAGQDYRRLGYLK